MSLDVYEHEAPSRCEVEVGACKLALIENAEDEFYEAHRKLAKIYAECGVLDRNDPRMRPRRAQTTEEAIEGAQEYAADTIANMIDKDRLEDLKILAAVEVDD